MRKPPLEKRFWQKVDVRGPNDCWPWTGATDSHGYGMAYSGRKDMPRRLIASRASWILTNGPIPDGLFVCHKCDNPICVNPAHLFLGTVTDNNRDALRKGRYLQPTCRRGHPRTEQNIKLWRSPGGRTFRICLRCRAITDELRKRKAVA